MNVLIPYLKRYYFYAVIIGVGISSALISLLYHSMMMGFNKEMMERNYTELILKVQTLERFVEDSKKMVIYLADDAMLQGYVKRGYEKRTEALLYERFLDIANVTPMIMQLRYLDRNGMERIRVDRNETGGLAYPITGTALQHKAHRYYFQVTAKEQKGQVWISDLDLNIEHGAIEIPYKPTLRIATPIYINGEFEGIVIVNLHMQEILSRLQSTPGYYTYIIDKDGNFLIHKDERYNWSRQRNLDYTIFNQFPEYAQKILDNEMFEGEMLFSKKMPLINREGLKLVLISEVRHELLTKNSRIAFMVVLPLALMLILVFALIINTFLTKKIKRLNEKMEKTIKEQVNTIRQKDFMLLQQSRMAIMGEMISMIAHQWRQPIATIGMISNNITISQEMGNLDDEKLRGFVKEIGNLVQYLSQTIDDFRNFFKTDKEKQPIDVGDAMDQAIKIIAKTLENHGITLDKKYRRGLVMQLYKGELQQVFVNLLSNAKDAIIASKKSDGQITIEFVVTKSVLNMQVCDNGGGIPEEHFQNIVEPYFTTKGNSGTGLGLYMCKSIVEKHMEGSLSYYNTEQGACFSIQLPLELQKGEEEATMK